MLALYRAGSQAEALEHYAAVRRELVDELGLEPGPELREMQERILRQDPALDTAAPAPAHAAPRIAPARPRRRAPVIAVAAVATLAVFGAAAALVLRGSDGDEADAAVAGDPASSPSTRGRRRHGRRSRCPASRRG